MQKMLRGPLKEWVAAQLSQSAVQNGVVFEANVVDKLWQKHISNRRDNIATLWPVLDTPDVAQRFMMSKE